MTDETVTLSPETRTWARQVLEHYRAVEALHSPVPRWQIRGAEDQASYSTAAEALASFEDGLLDHTEDELSTFAICGECARVEAAMKEWNEIAEYGYVESLYPCNTARAMGHTEDPE